MVRSLLVGAVFCLATSVSAEAVAIKGTADFEKKVFGKKGKSAFVKFLAPWMKPDWDELGEKYAKSKKVLIADVDCTAEANKDLCEEQGVKGYPTLKYYTPGDKMGSSYEGSRELNDLKAFIKTLGPACGPNYLKRCNETQLVELEGYMAMSKEDLQAKYDQTTGELKTAEETHNELLKSLQAQYEASNKALEALKAEKSPSIKLMSATLDAAADEAAGTEPPPKEEV